MRSIELLAPAKNKQTAIAAINYGCDALYIGAPDFSARKNAANSIEDLREIVIYAHKFNVKVYVAVNTIIEDAEIDSVKKLIETLYEIGIDAIIVQDMAILELSVKKEIPPIPIHASTQCDNRNLEKIKFFQQIGLPRVILAREMSLNQIKEICRQTDLEIEVFVHGALCVSYSGQCYMSCSIGGRSANRGECAQSCRKKYTLIDNDGKIIAKNLYLLSLKDFNASKHLKTMIDFGVKSFKIEGRLKDENYVKNIVAFYRKEIDKYAQKTSSGKIFFDFEPDVNKSFNRGFTDYFLEQRKDCFNFATPKSLGEKLGKVTAVGKDYFELNSKVNSQDGLCYFIEGELRGCLVNKVLGNKIYPNKMDKFDKDMIIYRNYDADFEKKLSNSKTCRKLGVSFLYNEKILHVKDEDGNETAMEIDSKEIPQNPDKMKEVFITQLKKTGESDFYVTKVEINGCLPFMRISEINNIRREILDKLMEERLSNYERDIQSPILYKKFPENNLDYKFNIHNRQARNFYEKCGCSIKEMSYEKMRPKNVELMRTKHCLKYAFKKCKSSDKLFLIDEKGKKYQLVFDCKNCEMAVIG